MLVKKIAIISHRRSEATRAALLQVLELCRQLDIEAVLPEGEMDKHSLEAGQGLATAVPGLDDVEVDFCVALGGDGTILRAFNRFPDLQTPVLGINFGRVGFLSAISPGQIESELRSILEGGYEILDLSLIEMANSGTKSLAVNDIVVHKPDGGSVVRLGYETNGVEFGPISCDGMVLATPAGSTAYNLSNGGPLLSLNLEALVLTAIAPHTLQFRALVLGPSEELVIRNETFGNAAAVYVDGRTAGVLQPGAVLELKLAPEKAHLVQTPGADFYRTLRDRFIQAET